MESKTRLPAPSDVKGRTDDPGEQHLAVDAPTVKTGTLQPYYADIMRPLTESDFGAPAAGQLIAREIARLNNENAALYGVREQYHSVKTELELLKEKAKKSKLLDIVGTGNISAGTLLIGASIKLYDTSQGIGVSAAIFGLILFAIGIVARSRSS